MTTRTDDYSAFAVPWGLHCFSGFVHHFRGLWTRLGDLETWSLKDSLAPISIDRPIYIAGLARSGSTILLEALAAHPDTASHRYRDFPGIFTPYWWDQAQRRQAASAPPRQRAHADGIAVTPDSPEAIEEMLWMAFFPRAHDSAANQVLDEQVEHPKFEAFYRDHLRKLLLARGGKRYLAKGNYNITRLGYLLKIFPEGRFVVPLRRPENHLASLMKQHRLFCAAERAHPRALDYMRRVGHFEFGLDRRPICTGDAAAAQSVVDLWKSGEEIRGWARHWRIVYGWLADELQRNDRLRQSVLVVRYEDVCRQPRQTLCQILDHCRLDAADSVLAFADRIAEPDYYRPQFSRDELAIIGEETRDVADRFGYESPSGASLAALNSV